jgi:hemoglobin-like flavoprotein
MDKRQKMYQKIEKHGEQLNNLFNTDLEPIALCKKLHRLESKAHRQATDYCNGAIQTDEWEEVSKSMLDKVDKILNFREKCIPVFFNADARGYSLKIDSDYMLAYERNTGFYQDWGGYGIIAPDFSDN